MLQRQRWDASAIEYCSFAQIGPSMSVLRRLPRSIPSVSRLGIISQNDRFIVSNILYEYRSAKLNETAKKELDKLVLIMKKNPKIVIELSSHTDSKGGDSYNMKLSNERAKKAKEYIISKGIDEKRIVSIGYGETKPIAPNTNPDGSDNPEGRAKNRRTEIRIIKW